MFCGKQMDHFMRESAKNALKTRNVKHMTIAFGFYQFQHYNRHLIVLCAMFRGKQTKFEPLHTRKCQKHF